MLKMKVELQAKLNEAKSKRKEIKKGLTRLKNRPPKNLDSLFQEEHNKVFSQLDCLDCANCCKTTSPIFYDKDVERMATFFKLKPSKFFDTYLKVDEDGDQVLKSSPCPFLQQDNKCSAYESRPKACREYPHTNRKRMYQIMDLTTINSRICPAVSNIVINILKL